MTKPSKSSLDGPILTMEILALRRIMPRTTLNDSFLTPNKEDRMTRTQQLLCISNMGAGHFRKT